VRLDSNDYSVDPAMIGRRIEVMADLERVRAFCGGRMTAEVAFLTEGTQPARGIRAAG
jgi:hypothetical protein